MDTILNDYIQDYLHSDKFIDMLEYFIAKYNESADSIRKRGLHKRAEFLMRQSPCIGKWDKDAWDDGDMEEEFPNFVWPDGLDYVWTADWIAEVIPDPKEYNEEGVRGLIDDLLLSYDIIEE